MNTNSRTKTTHGCSASYSSAAKLIGSNQHLLVQILARLPSKSLLKFKCVSKEWQSLISSPHFARCCKPHLNSPCALLVEEFSTDDIVYEFVSLDSTHTDAPFKSLTFVDDPQLSIVGSSNGLLLCESGQRYYVYNPTTKQRTQLPPVRLPRCCIGGLYLAFDPLDSPYYKVIWMFGKMLDNNLETNYEFEVYSSEQRRWKTCAAAPFTCTSAIDFRHGVFWNGSIHWLSYERDDTSMYFNINQDQPHIMPSPLTHETLGRTLRQLEYFGESRDHLHVIEINPPGSIQFNVYEMPKDYSGWRVKYRVNLGALLTSFPEMVNPRNGRHPNHYKFKILCISRGETDEDSFMVLQTPRKIVRYELKDGASFRKLCDSDDAADEERLMFPPRLIWKKRAYQYFESLACV